MDDWDVSIKARLGRCFPCGEEPIVKSPVLSVAALVLVACLANCSRADAPYAMPPTPASADRAVSQPLATSSFESLYSFRGKPDGDRPQAPLVALNGNLYGTTPYGGSANRGMVFEIDTSGQERVLYSFHGLRDGATPMAGAARIKMVVDSTEPLIKVVADSRTTVPSSRLAPPEWSTCSTASRARMVLIRRRDSSG